MGSFGPKVKQNCTLEIPFSAVVDYLRRKGWPIPPDTAYGNPVYTVRLDQDGISNYDERRGARGKLIFDWSEEKPVVFPAPVPPAVSEALSSLEPTKP